MQERGSGESTSTNHILTAELINILESQVDPNTNPATLLGVRFDRGNPIALDFIPDGKKVTVQAFEEDESFKTYSMKTDGYYDGTLHMPRGLLTPGQTHDGSHFEQTPDGMRVASSGGIFYINKLDKLEFSVVDKNAGEIMEMKLKEAPELNKYEHAGRNIKELGELMLRLEAVVEDAESFDPDSPFRYSTDTEEANIYRVHDDGLEHLAEFTRIGNGGKSIYGDFLGNRLAIIDSRLLVVDDETGLAVGARDDLRIDRPSGFNVAIRNSNDSFRRRVTNDTLAERFNEQARAS
jgi:hypothetical protein